ncbi:MAG: AmmeMemoRadiSam system protein A [Nitrospiraceae bacterium]|nr:MAG: AmmeMemoRadiSam system protein A [Nitrospiraceae bacterium]
MHPLVKLAKAAVEHYVSTGKIIAPPDSLSPEMAVKAGVFVCIKINGELRGCIGTFSPCAGNVACEIIRNAVSAAACDPRFSPVKAKELDTLEYSVDVLTEPEKVAGRHQLDSRRYGVIVESGERRGLLLPDLEGVDTVDEQISIASMKAGIFLGEPVELYRFEVKRYK